MIDSRYSEIIKNKPGKKLNRQETSIKINERKKHKCLPNLQINENYQECYQLLIFLSLGSQEDKKKTFNITVNSLIKISDFLNIRELVQILNLNKKFRYILLKNSCLLSKYFSICDFYRDNHYIFDFYFKENNFSPEIAISVNNIFERLSYGIDINQINHLIQVILTPYFQKDNLIIENIDEKIRYQCLMAIFPESGIKNLYLYDQLNNQFQIDCFSTIIRKKKIIESLHLVYPFSEIDLSSFLTAWTENCDQYIEELYVTFIWQKSWNTCYSNLKYDDFNTTIKYKKIEKLNGNFDLSFKSTQNMLSSNFSIKHFIIKGVEQTMTCDYGFLKFNKFINYLEFSNSVLSEYALKKLFEVLINCHGNKLSILSFEDSLYNLDEDLFFYLGSQLNKLPNVSTLKIKEKLEGEELQGLFKALINNTTIKNLYISDLDYLSSESLIKCLKINRSILKVEYNSASLQDLRFLNELNPNLNLICKTQSN
jgi:hypothetical protein